MKAMVCPEKNLPLQLQELPEPVAGRGEAVVQLKAAALNHRDLWICQGQYANLRYPIVPGSDGSGMVTAIGEDVPNSWLHKEVVINPAMNWGDQPAYHGKAFTILGLPDNGCLAGYVKVPATALHVKPAYLSFEEAAAIPLAGLTAYRALFTRGQLAAGNRVLVTGIGGGVALMALQMAVAAGAQVYVTSGSDDKIAKALQLGAAGGVNYTTRGWYKFFQSSVEGFDVVIDSAAGEGFKHFIDLAKPGARIVLYGGTQGAIGSLNPQKLFWKQLNILGTTMGRPEEFSEMLALFETHRIHPVIDEIVELEATNEALHKMEQAAQFGKLVLRIHQ